MGLIKAFLTFFGELFGFMREKQLIDAGEAKAEGKQAREALETIETVRAPIDDAERERVREKYRRP